MEENISLRPETIYVRKYPPLDPEDPEDMEDMEELAALEKEMTDEKKRAIDKELDEIMLKAKYTPLAKRLNHVEEFIDKAILIGEQQRLDTEIVQLRHGIRASYAIKGGSLSYLMPLLKMADEFSVFPPQNGAPMTALVLYITHVVAYNKRVCIPSKTQIEDRDFF